MKFKGLNTIHDHSEPKTQQYQWGAGGYFDGVGNINIPSVKSAPHFKGVPQLISADLIAKEIYSNIEGALETLKENTKCKTFSEADKKISSGWASFDGEVFQYLRSDCALLYTMLVMLDTLKIEPKYRRKRIDKEAWKWQNLVE